MCLISQHGKSLLFNFAEILKRCQNTSKSGRGAYLLFFLISELEEVPDAILQTRALVSLSVSVSVLSREALAVSHKEKFPLLACIGEKIPNKVEKQTRALDTGNYLITTHLGGSSIN